jgi:hypothetical protein
VKKYAPMYEHWPTPEQADRIKEAIREVRERPLEQEQTLSAVEMAMRQTGDGLPEQMVDSLINMIVGRTPPRPIDRLTEELFGRLPDTIFEELGQLAAFRALSERLVGTLLRTLGYTGELKPPPSLFNLCEEQATVLRPDLRRAVVVNLDRCRDVERWQHDYELQVIHRYRTGKFDTDGRGLDSFDMDNAPENAAQTVLELRNLIDQCERR